MNASSRRRAPIQAWVVTFAGTLVNLCLGILYAWSIWKARLIATPEHPAGSAMSGVDDGWTYLTDAQATWAYAICGFTFAVAMIAGGRVQDRFGPRWGATLGGILLGGGCILAGLIKSYLGVIAGFGVLGGIGMGLGYAAATPAAMRWFAPQRRGLVAGLVVAGYGGAAIYIAPLAKFLIAEHGLSFSFIGLGTLFTIVIVAAAQLLKPPPPDYVPDPTAGAALAAADASNTAECSPGAMLGTWQFYALVMLFIGSAQSGLLVIANAVPMLNKTAEGSEFLAAHAWLLASFGGFVNAAGRVGTGMYSDKLGRANAYSLNGIVSAACLLATPWVMRSGNAALLFVVVGVAYWQYGGGLSLMPAMTADYFGATNLGLKYGLVFIGWGVAFFVPQLAGYIKDATGSLDGAFYLSGGLLIAAIILSRIVRRPTQVDEAVEGDLATPIVEPQPRTV